MQSLLLSDDFSRTFLVKFSKTAAKIHIKSAKSKNFELGVGFTMVFCGIFVILTG